MKNPIQALLWEQYRQTRWQIAIAVTLFVVYVTFSNVVLVFGFKIRWFNHYCPDANTWFILFALIPSLFINPGAKNVEESFPKRLFTLSVATEKLVAVQILYNCR